MVKISTNSIILNAAGDGVFEKPPATMARVGEDTEVVYALTAVLSPKSTAFPVYAIVIYSIGFV